MRVRRLLPFLLVLLVPTGLARAEGVCSDPATRPALEEITALRLQGDHAAVHRLNTLLREGGPEVRRAAVLALGQVGLRSEAAAEAVRRSLRTIDVAGRQEALETLGRIGDARDVEALLSALRQEDAGLRTTALSALRALTGRRLPVSPTRCALWWRSSAPNLRKAVQEAIDAAATADSHRKAEVALATLARDGWVEMEAVSGAARDWLRSTNHGLRAAGFELVAALRLADLASDVESALPFVGEEDAKAGLRAAEVLGLSTDLLPPTWRLRLQPAALSAR